MTPYPGGMDSTPTVWGVGTPRTFRVHWMLHELGLDYETRPIQPRTGETRTPEYLALDPRGKIPVWQDGDFVLSESGAITAWLADHHAPGRFAPAPGTRERAVHDQWCHFVLMELDATSLYVVRRHGDLAAIYGEAPRAISSSLDYFRKLAGVAEAQVARTGALLLGPELQVADILLTSCLSWAGFVGVTLPPALAAYRERAIDRAAYRAAMAINFPPEVLEALAAAPGEAS